MPDKIVLHPIPPIYDKNSKILILGSFPSVKSRELGFFYSHPQNRFWKVLPALFGEAPLLTAEDKTSFLLKHQIALWDVIKSCQITGSSDSSIKDAVPNDISKILGSSKITKIFTNGTTAYNLYNKYIFPKSKIEAVKLPSTSPANAAYSLDRLILNWNILLL